MTATIDSVSDTTTGPDVIDLRTRAPRPEKDQRPRLGYQPALDGLRAIAVLAVLLYHADVSWMPGGFLGVDVFFVLSGFLITTLLLEGATALGSPDFKQFYLRRARRLLPAMFAVVIGSTLLVITVATDGAGNQQRDVPAALTYVLNWVYVFTDQSYFEATGRPPMLEHLWSLAVEEQFYLIWPWVFLLAWRMGRSERVRRFALIGAVASTALMAAISILQGAPTDADPSRVYFGTDTHAMGLLTGAALATLWLPRRARADLVPGARATVDAIGAACLLLVALFFWQTRFDSVWLYRGGFLVLSVVVAVLVVAVTHPASRVGLLLGTAPMRYVGTRSYGIYLWHWPIFLITRPGLDVPLTGAANLALRFALTFGIAELSYRYLEMPIRRYGFTGAWHALMTRLQARGGRFERVAARPVLILAVCAAILAAMTLRLYTLPAQQDYLNGVTNLVAGEPAATPDGSQEGADAAGAAPASPGPADGTPAAEQAAAVLQPGVLGVGESVMIGAGGAIARQIPGVVLDASVGRQEKDVVARINEMAASGLLHEQVFVHMGSNGPITEAGLRAVLDTLATHGVKDIAVVNVSVPRRWQDPNNAVIAAVVPNYPGVALVDWHAAVLADPDLVVADGIHPSKPGVEKYAELITAAFAGMDQRSAEFVDGEPVLQDEDEVRDHPAVTR